MLELNNYYNTSIDNLKDFIIVSFVIIDDIYQKVTPAYIKNRKNIDSAILSDSEIITISLVGELLTIDSEKAWFGFCTKSLMICFLIFAQELDFTEPKSPYLKLLTKLDLN